jgi:hypothetical protein
MFPRPDSRSIQREIDAGVEASSGMIAKFSQSSRFRRNVKALTPKAESTIKPRRPRKSEPSSEIRSLGRVRRPVLEHTAEMEPVRSVFDISKTPNSPPWDRVREVLQESYPAERYLLVGLHFSSKDGAEVVTLTIKKDPRS